VYRAQALAEKLDLDLVLAEVKDGRLALLEDAGAAGTPFLLSLDLPKEIKEKKAKQDSTASEEPAAVELKGRVQNSADTEDEKTRLEARQRQARKSFVAAAGQLVERDITFGFSVQDVKASDIRKNLKELVDAGLSEEKALAALTTEPASMLGISDVAGSVEEGKIANLLVTTGSYFDENSAIRYVFVDGKKFEYKASNKKSGGSGEGAVEVAGTWTYELESPMGASSGTIVIEGSEGDYEGVFTNEQFPGEPELESISVDGNSLSMSVTIDAGGQSMTVQIVCTVDGDEMEGSMDVGQMGSFPLEATRTSDPDQQ